MLDCFGHFNIFSKIIILNQIYERKLRLLGGEICD